MGATEALWLIGEALLKQARAGVRVCVLARAGGIWSSRKATFQSLPFTPLVA